ncbi:hypothetical protein BEN44_20940, partial [Leptospira interrogans serovar Ricardi]|nr:hypothetical protein [Leptospira interrogans serovar Ricardi]
EGYIAFHKVLERDLLNPRTEIELSIGNILFLCIVDKNYEKIQAIFQRYSDQKTKDFLEQQAFLAVKRWNAGFKERFMIKKAIIIAQIKNLVKLT